MADGFQVPFDACEDVRKYTDEQTVEDVFTFRLHRLTAISERAAQICGQSSFDLSLNEWRLLALVKSRAPTRAGGLADILLMDKSQTSRVTKSLLNKRLIRSFPDPDDGRAIALEPTDEGLLLYHRIFEDVIRSNEMLLDVLSAEEVQLLDSILGKLTERGSDLLEALLARPLLR
ncbi:MarR family transcriptional regulator [Sulfitobacter sp. M57]|uniref:MarR family winged helix-turn-helix transcriptional regulator n=1 Tax=unclassified Sulfitobacter TaxID=196795 RepID=UPI0023E31B57|nr:MULTISPECIES: MarR family transcriptional regulator [unclassified Sulfitobacter]MDF3414662.1 MarR family transcriptional regulator [Sulfitobacter sp. KE5]MDF3422143.1 MarR family transcriptional regulator [Sulfitobacter sp. KE43]MDF3433208.1 MarR family transcriptional regulator [Sulfitobacter sp. KE42]MDF3458848.1 MarR family transcriptional regulator [Sulfitobacter sp. S74]MDF3462747.1 MarR family transcriptional regulator [Sulfitobacter sp. Ks18]